MRKLCYLNRVMAPPNDPPAPQQLASRPALWRACENLGHQLSRFVGNVVMASVQSWRVRQGDEGQSCDGPRWDYAQR
jgi:hypothetical protein